MNKFVSMAIKHSEHGLRNSASHKGALKEYLRLRHPVASLRSDGKDLLTPTPGINILTAIKNRIGFHNPGKKLSKAHPYEGTKAFRAERLKANRIKPEKVKPEKVAKEPKLKPSVRSMYTEEGYKKALARQEALKRKNR